MTDRYDDDDPLTDRSPDGVLWSRVNTSEILPGVLTPVSWSFYGRQTETSARHGWADLGVIPRSATGYPHPVEDRFLGVFFGRCAANVNVLRVIMGGLPGVTGDDIERDVLGSVRDGVVDQGYRWRLPAVLIRLPRLITLVGRRAERFRAESFAWWARQVDATGLRPGNEPRAALAGALDRFGVAIRLQAGTRLAYSGSTAAIARLADRAGRPELTGHLLCGRGASEETVIADDLWALAQGGTDLASFLRHHGYCGPNVGELSSRSWRENPAPVESLLPTLKEAERPDERRRRAQDGRARAVAELLGALPRPHRRAAAATLRLTPSTGRALECNKAAMQLALDVGRAAVRGIGADLVAAGRMDEPDHAFQLFADELLHPPRGDLRARLTRRLAARQRYQALEIPETWEGQPTAGSAAPKRQDAEVTRVAGMGVSGGRAEGPVRIVLDPDDATEIEIGDILVCPTTDPSWVSLMTLAAALVIDIGGPASHGAIVAREIGIPCVIGTHTGTSDLHDGDRVRVDGSAGTVDILVSGRRQ
ncbi:MAG TPA: PEP-utilizing enzyme [Acidimicrobiia bacterium]|nr:PEP-utilizing enzyme [Acidimicrobiia bacterium]